MGPALAPMTVVLACLGTALAIGSSSTTPRAGVVSLASEGLPTADDGERVEPERIELRSDRLLITGPEGVVARRQPLTPNEVGLTAAVLIELSAEPGYELWRTHHGRALENNLTLERFEGSGRTFVRASLSGADLPAVESLLESKDGQLVRLDMR